LTLLVSCGAALGIACGGTSDAREQFDAGGGADAIVMADARLPDARQPDAAAADARADAGQADAGADARLDATPGDAGQIDANLCPGGSDPECGGEEGLTCVDGNTEQQCDEIAPGCFKLVGSPAACSTNKSCPGVGVGCVCEASPLCDAGEGTYCGTRDGTAATAQSVYACEDAEGDGDECIVPVEATDCVTPTVCDEATAGEATCECPDPGTLPDTSCTPDTQQQCASDDGSVIECNEVTASGETCNVWVIVEDCRTNGLTCSGQDCVCPDTGNQKEFFANPVVDRTGFEDLLPTGASSPAICMYKHLYQAIDQAIFEGAGGVSATFAVASDLDAPEGTTEAVFDEEEFPFVIPDNVTVTTIDHPRFSAEGTPIRSDYFKIKANYVPATNPSGAEGFIWLQGRPSSSIATSPGGSLIGYQVDLEACRDLGTATEDFFCAYPNSVVHITGFSGHPEGGLEVRRPNMHATVINGAGAGDPALAQPAGMGLPAVSGVLSGGEISTNSNGTFTYTAADDPDPNDTRFDEGWFDPNVPLDCDSFVLVIEGAENDGNNSAFVVYPPLGANSVVAGGNGAVDEELPDDATATLLCLRDGVDNNSVPAGIRVSGNALIEDTVAMGFMSETGVRSGIYVEDVFNEDGVVINGGGAVGNDTGLWVDGTQESVAVTVGVSPTTGSANPAFTASGNLDRGVYVLDDCEVEETVFTATGMVVENTFRPMLNHLFGLGSGTGIVLEGAVDVTLTDAESSGNAVNGVGVNLASQLIEVPLPDLNNAKPGNGCSDAFGSIVIDSSELSDNGFNGLETSTFGGTIEITGGTISDNGTDLGVKEFAQGDGNDPDVFAVGSGIYVHGCITGEDADGSCMEGFFTGASEGGERLTVSGNERSGLRASQSHLYLSGTTFTANSTANLCLANRTMQDARDAAVVLLRNSLNGTRFRSEIAQAPSLVAVAIATGAVAHFTDVRVNENFGTGIRLSTSDTRPNTISNSQVNDNMNILDCEGGFSPHQHSYFVFVEASPSAQTAKPQELPPPDEEAAQVETSGGIHVRRDGHLQVTDGVTQVDNNAKHGIIDSGKIDRFTAPRDTELGDPNDPDEETNGTWSIDLNGWNGFFVTSYASDTEIRGGNITGNGDDPEENTPDDGVRIIGDPDVEGLAFYNDVRITTTTIDENVGDGVSVETHQQVCNNTTQASDMVFLDDVTLSGNGGAGANVLSAPGLVKTAEDVPPGTDPNDPCQLLTDVPLNVTDAMYGFTITDSEVTGNANGLVFGVGADEEAQVVAMVAVNEIHSNEGVGVIIDGGDLEEASRLGVTVDSNRILNNDGSGVVLGNAILVPVFTTGFENLGLGFLNNSVFNNAFAEGSTTCTAAQSEPQILVSGTTASTAAREHCAGLTEGTQCEDADGRDGTNWHCARPSSQAACVAVHDLRGGIDDCSSSIQNSIYGYNTTDDAVTGRSVGILSVTGGQANANINDYGSATGAENTDVAGGGGFILNNVNPCMVLSCSR
jgi:hypothetical protein